jgi:hypothetical protein
VTCSAGTSTCEGGVWGPCQGNTIYSKSLNSSSIGGGGVHVRAKTMPCPIPWDAGADAGPHDLCDPNECPPSFGDAGDFDASGLILADSGISLVPVDGGTICSGLECQVSLCTDAGTSTTVTGKVFDPAGLNPLYGAWVYIPNDPTVPLPTFKEGVSCGACSGAPSPPSVAVAQTAADGSFTLNYAPNGTNIPIVVQLGKWRRKITLPNVAPCTKNAIPDGTLHLPRNHTDGDNNTADIPQIAFVSGSADPFQCMLLKMGLDPNEFGSSAANANRRIHYYNSPDSPSSSIDPAYGSVVTADTLWSDPAKLASYDVVVLACEGGEFTDHGRMSDAGASGFSNLVDYTGAGGRVFLSHYSYTWMRYSQPWAGIPATWNGTASVATQDPLTATITTRTTTGTAFRQWLYNVGASTTFGYLDLHQARQDTTMPLAAGVNSWMIATDTQPNALSAAAYSPTFTFDTPLNSAPANACGRVAFSDYHVTTSALDTTTTCATDADCGYGSTCVLATPATCTLPACTPSSEANDCGDTRYTCEGATKGSCGCSTDADCSPIGAGTCVAGRCSTSTCYVDGDCWTTTLGCNGSVQGACTPNTCMTNADCQGEVCFNGRCGGCYTVYQCNAPSTCSNGNFGSPPPSTCSGNTQAFPYACVRGPLDPQEKALEFELLDLTACGVPPPPAAAYLPVTFTEDFNYACGMGTHVVWRELDWQAVVPDTASIVFSAQTVESPVDGGPPDFTGAQSVQLADATTTTANLPAGTDGVLIDVGADASMPGAFNSATPPVASLSNLRLTVTLNPTATHTMSPTLIQWQVKADCLPSE